jgi:hypothetical protein
MVPRVAATHFRTTVQNVPCGPPVWKADGLEERGRNILNIGFSKLVQTAPLGISGRERDEPTAALAKSMAWNVNRDIVQGLPEWSTRFLYRFQKSASFITGKHGCT